jgi:hypothetical protein
MAVADAPASRLQLLKGVGFLSIDGEMINHKGEQP